MSQGISGLACLAYMVKKYPILRMSLEERQPDGRSCKVLCSMGIPMGLQYSITAIGSIILQASVNTLGSTYVAAVAAGTKLYQLLACPFDAMGATMPPIAARMLAHAAWTVLVRVYAAVPCWGWCTQCWPF